VDLEDVRREMGGGVEAVHKRMEDVEEAESEAGPEAKRSCR